MSERRSAADLLRHAKSSWSDPTLPDWERPLAQRGRRDARRVGEHLVRLGIVPDLVLCCSARRAREMLKLVRAAFGATTSVLLEAELYAASAEKLLERLRAVPDGAASVLVIGHDPGLHDFALLLASAGAGLERLEAKFPTAALATLALPKATWSQLSPADAVPRRLRGSKAAPLSMWDPQMRFACDQPRGRAARTNPARTISCESSVPARGVRAG